MDGRPPLALRAGPQYPAVTRQSLPDLVAKHRALVSRMVRSFARKAPAANPEDLEQEAHIALWNAAIKFNSERGKPFSHYASVCLKNALQAFVNVERARVGTATASLDGVDHADPDGAEPQRGVNSSSDAYYFGNPSSGRAYQRYLMLEIATYVQRLSPQLRVVYHDHVLAGRSQRDVAQALCVTQQRVAALKTELFHELLELLSEPD